MGDDISDFHVPWSGWGLWCCFAFALLPLRFSYLPGRPSWMCLFDTAHFEFLVKIFKNFCNVPRLTLHSVLNRWGVIRILDKISETRIRYRNFSHIFACKFILAGWSILIMKTSRNSCCGVKWGLRLSLGCLYQRYSVFYNLRILSIVRRYDLGIMYYLSKILLRILPRVPWSPRCSKNLVQSCQDSHDASKRVNPGSLVFELCANHTTVFVNAVQP